MTSKPRPPRLARARFCASHSACTFPSFLSFVGAVVTVKPFAFVPALLAVLLLLLSACGTTPPPEFKGRWRPVNHFAAVPQEIPLQQAYAFYASPMDGTLKHMLERWARDAHMTLDYRHPSDYTLVAPVADVRTGNPPTKRNVAPLLGAESGTSDALAAMASPKKPRMAPLLAMTSGRK